MRDNLFGGLCKLFVVIWSAFCLMAASYGFLEGSARVELADYSARVDVLMRVGLWALVWFFPAAAAVVFYLMFGRTQIAVTVMTAAAAPAKRKFPYVRWRTLFMGAAAAAVLVGAIGPRKLVDRARSEWQKRLPPQVAGMLVAGSPSAPVAAAPTADVAAASAAPGTPPGTKWKSSKRTDPRDGTELAHALLPSDTSFMDRFGAAHQPKLHIWCTEARTRVYVEVGAPLDTGYDTTTVRVRLDEEKPETISGPGSTNGEAFFFPDPIAMLRRMKGRKSMRVEFPLFREGNPIAAFDLRGMEPHVAMIEDACGWD
jgi:hypothetical protein